jgi:hypothetical protein
MRTPLTLEDNGVTGRALVAGTCRSIGEWKS